MAVQLRGSPACDECNQTILEKSEVGSDGALMCEKCAALRLERKEAIHEIVDTEISYGKDLKIIKEVWSEKTNLTTIQELHFFNFKVRYSACASN